MHGDLRPDLYWMKAVRVRRTNHLVGPEMIITVLFMTARKVKVKVFSRNLKWDFIKNMKMSVLTVGLFLFALTSAKAVEGVSFDAWMQAIESRSNMPKIFQALQQEQNSWQLSSQAALLEDPSTFEADTRATNNNGFNSGKVVGSLSYRKRSGLNIQIETDAINSLSSPNTVSDSNRIDMNVAYDILAGGSQSRSAIQARLNSLESKQNQNKAAQELLTTKLALIRSLVSLYFAQCKTHYLQSAESAIKEAEQFAREQSHSKVISHKQFLTFQDLANKFSRELTSQQAVLEQNRLSLSVYGDDYNDSVVKSLNDKIQCEFDLTQLARQSEKILELEIKTDSWVAVLPAQKLLTIGSSLALENLNFIHAQGAVSLSPYLGSTYHFPVLSSRAPIESYFGFRFLWNIPDEAQKQNEESARGVRLSSDLRTASGMDSNKYFVSLLFSQIKTEIKNVQIQERSLKNSVALLNTIKLEQSISLSDPITYALASINALEAKLALLTSIGNLKVAGASIQTIGSSFPR